MVENMADDLVYLDFQSKKTGKVVKCTVKPGTKIGKGTCLFAYEVANNGQNLKYRSSDVGTVVKVLKQEGDELNLGDHLLLMQACQHPIVIKEMCAECGADLKEVSQAQHSASVAMVHSIPELIVSEEQAHLLGKADEDHLIKNRKLVLLVDLDQTLIHTTNDQIPPNIKDVYHFQLYGSRSPWYHTRLRPGTLQFLENISQLYELHICTFGARTYAHTIARLLDKDGKFFSHRILSRDECFNPTSKTANLKALFPCGDSMVCIIDDREDVWNYAPNLIHVKPYHFFQHTGDINAPPGLTKTEHDSEGPKFIVSKGSVDKQGEHNLDQNGSNVILTNSNEDEKNDTDADTQTKGSESDNLNDGLVNQTAKKPSTVENEVIHGNAESIKDQDSDEKESSSVEMVSTSEKNVVKERVTSSDVKESVMSLDVKESVTSSDVKESVMSLDVKESVTSSDVKESVMSLDVKESVDQMETCTDLPDTSAKSVDSTEVVETTLVKQSDSDLKEKLDAKGDVEKQETDSSVEKMDSSVEKMENSVNEMKIVPTSENKPKDASSVEGIFDKPNTKVIDSNEELEEMEAEKNDESNMTDGIDIYQGEVIIHDDDDHLLHLEEKLQLVHKAYYDLYDKVQKENTAKIPDIKVVISDLRKKVLADTYIVFSGVFPMHLPPEKNKTLLIATSLGATVQTQLFPRRKKHEIGATTHVVAARLGTAKVNEARKLKYVHIVNPQWLWCCAERWEKVAECLFPLTKETAIDYPLSSIHLDMKSFLMQDAILAQTPPSKPVVREEVFPLYDPVTGKRIQKLKQMPTRTSMLNSDVKTPSQSQFENTINPLLRLSSEEIAEMDQEVEDIFNESDSDQEQEGVGTKRKRKTSSGESSSDLSDESLSGDHPRGWRSEGKRLKTNDEAESEDSEVELPRFPRSVLPHDSDESVRSGESDFNESVGSVDEEMAAAVEREFLGS